MDPLQGTRENGFEVAQNIVVSSIRKGPIGDRTHLRPTPPMCAMRTKTIFDLRLAWSRTLDIVRIPLQRTMTVAPTCNAFSFR